VEVPSRDEAASPVTDENAEKFEPDDLPYGDRGVG
jgi:hypothetical protein